MHRKPSRIRSRGFTLIELMVAVAIIAILAMMAAPSFSGYLARTKLRGAASEAYSHLQFARSESVQKNRVVTVEMSSSGYTVWLMQAAAPATKDRQMAKADWSGTGVSVASGSTMVVTFNPVRGTATTVNGPLELSHGSITGTARVAVNLTGRAELCSPSGTLTGVASC